MTNIELMNYWIKSAEEDYKTMKVLYENKQYNWCLFIAHLVVEKLLKGLYAKKNIENPYAPKIHDLLRIAEKLELNITEEQEEILDTITRFNINARYEDYKNEFYKKCTEEYTTKQINNVEEVIVWIKELLKEESEK